MSQEVFFCNSSWPIKEKNAASERITNKSAENSRSILMREALPGKLQAGRTARKMAAARASGFRGGTIYGETDDFSYNIVRDPVHIRDFHATVLNQLGYDHERLSFRYQGLDQRLTGVLPAKVIEDLLT